MENMAHLQEQAFQSLFKWTQVILALFNPDRSIEKWPFNTAI